MLDSRYHIETPEGIELELTPVGPTARALAWVVDALVRSAVYVVAGIFLAFLGSLGEGFLLLLIFVMEWFYPVWFEVWRDGMTPGKKTLGIKVVQVDGTPVRFSASMLRNLLRVVDFLPMFYGIGVISMLTNSRFQRLGDLSADTLVVYQPRKRRGMAELDCEVVNPAVVLTAEEAQAVVQFSERSKQISESRRDELAELAEPLVAEQQQPANRVLCGVARWLVGGR